MGGWAERFLTMEAGSTGAREGAGGCTPRSDLHSGLNGTAHGCLQQNAIWRSNSLFLKPWHVKGHFQGTCLSTITGHIGATALVPCLMATRGDFWRCPKNTQHASEERELSLMYALPKAASSAADEF